MAAEEGHELNRSYRDQDGNIHLNGASLFNASEVDIKTAPSAVAAGYKIARGEAALDGSNPTNVITGLATVVAFVATLKGAAAPGDNTSVLTVDLAGPAAGSADVYAWKNTGGTDPTLVASTETESFYWVAIGT